MASSTRRSSASSSAERRLAPALGLILLLAAPAAARAPRACRDLAQRQPAFPWASDWDSLRLAETCLAARKLTSEQRRAAWLSAARLRLNLGDAPGAELAADAALALRPEDPEALRLSAEIRRDRPEQALVFAERARDERLTGEILADLGDAAGAVERFKRALEADSADFAAWLAYAAVDPAAASGPLCAKAATEPEWRRASALLWCAEALVDREDYAGAAARLREALALRPWSIDLVNAMLRVRHRRPELAAELAKGPGRAPRGPAVTGRLELDSLDPASARFSAAIAAAPAWLRFDAILHGLERRAAAGERDGAAEAARLMGSDQLFAALEFMGVLRYPGLDPLRASAELKTIHHDLADAQRALGLEEAARSTLRRALDAAPENMDLLAMFADAELAAGRPAAALPYAERLLAAAEKRTPRESLRSLGSNDAVVAAMRPKDGRYDLSDPAVAAFARERLRAERARALETMLAVRAALGEAGEQIPLLERLAAASAGPARARALERSAELRALAGDAAGAESDLEAALSAAPGSTTTLRALFDLRLETASALREAGDDAGAARGFESALALDPDDARALRPLAELKDAAGNPRDALVLLERLIAVAATAPAEDRRGWFMRTARLRAELGDRAGAETDLGRALEAAPSDPRVWRALVDLGFDPAAPERSAAFLGRHAPPGAPLRAAWKVLGGMARAGGDAAGARAAYAEGLKLDPDAACGSALLGGVRPRLGADYFTLCVERFPQRAPLRVERGIALYLAGAASAAVDDFHAAIELDPGYVDAYLSLASALIGDRREIDALAVLDMGHDAAATREGPSWERLVRWRDELRASVRAGR